ncbi:MAG: orotate phosphoribosyltransferase [Arenicellales bacterium]|jgi:orotate phosphoribosyltransferase
MQSDKNNFIKLCIENKILRFGEFTLKSGRISPYFFNAGLFNNGQLLAELAGYYAALIVEKLLPNLGGFMLYGPAYKGIPLAAATAVQLSSQYAIKVDYAFNRKETKDHGEGGKIVGAPLHGNVLIIDDVITAGTSVRESIDIIKSEGATPAAVVIALDRQEVTEHQSRSAVQSVEHNYKLPVHAIIMLEDLIDHLQQDSVNQNYAEAVINYRNLYGSESD